jgi:predicted nucleic acid-binding protein
MIVMDTNVLSEPLRPKPSAKVMEWMRSQPNTGVVNPWL